MVSGEISGGNNGNGQPQQIGANVNDDWMLAKPTSDKQPDQGIPPKQSNQDQNPLVRVNLYNFSQTGFFQVILSENAHDADGKNGNKKVGQIETVTKGINGDSENVETAQPKSEVQFQQPIGHDFANAPSFFFQVSSKLFEIVLIIEVLIQVDDPNQQQPHSLT